MAFTIRIFLHLGTNIFKPQMTIQLITASQKNSFPVKRIKSLRKQIKICLRGADGRSILLNTILGFCSIQQRKISPTDKISPVNVTNMETINLYRFQITVDNSGCFLTNLPENKIEGNPSLRLRRIGTPITKKIYIFSRQIT